jgi:hypothetical protein
MTAEWALGNSLWKSQSFNLVFSKAWRMLLVRLIAFLQTQVLVFTIATKHSKTNLPFW